ncbi:MAG: DUF167 domain-containing protein [bacterium]
MNWITASGDGVAIALRVVPRASRNEVGGIVGDALKLRLCAPPVDGKANDAVVDFLSDALDVPRSRISIRTGAKGRSKLVMVGGVTVQAAMKRLGM